MKRAHGKEFASVAEQRRFEASGKHLEQVVHEDCFVRHTDKDGNTHVQHHRVWNRDRFAQALARAAAQVGGKARAEVITEGQYRTGLKTEELRGARADNPSRRRR